MDLPISEGGEGLSGGQRQLVALARVFVNQPRIWLFDEPTASMDRDMEQRVWQALETALRPDDIVVVSTHRPMLASRLVDRVLIMQRGRVVQDRSPETLLPRMVGRPTAKAADNEQNDAL
jgi:ATP-binding cassette subfamily C protein LapB